MTFQITKLSPSPHNTHLNQMARFYVSEHPVIYLCACIVLMFSSQSSPLKLNHLNIGIYSVYLCISRLYHRA